MSVAAIHYLARDKQVVGVWIAGVSAYLPGYPRAEADGRRIMNTQPEGSDWDSWAKSLSGRTPTFRLWWETTAAAAGETPDQLLSRMQPQ